MNRVGGSSTKSGFSLLELMIAFGLITVAILGLIGVFASGLGLSGQSRNVASATELGREVIERIKFEVEQVGFGYVPGGTYSFDGHVPDVSIGSPPFPPPPYQTAWMNNQEFVISVTGSELSPTFKEIRVTVSWDKLSKVILETRLHR